MGKAISNERIIAALMTSGTISEAAAKLKISARTIYDRMGTKEFVAVYSAAKADLLRGTLLDINKKLSEAVETVTGIMNDEDINPAIRLQAARTLLSNAVRFSERLQSDETTIFKCSCSEWDTDLF